MIRYNIILADPPWPYASRSPHKKTRFGGGCAGHYETMSVERIARIPVGRDLAASSAVLFMWVTGPHLASGLTVMDGWGFSYSTIAFTWVKTNKNQGDEWTGPGFYTRSNQELVLLGTRGKVLHPANKAVKQVIRAPHPRDEAGKIIHSRKPAELRERIVTLMGDLPRVELFAREAAPGWHAIGNQLGEEARTLVPQATLFDWANRPIEVAL